MFVRSEGQRGHGHRMGGDLLQLAAGGDVPEAHRVIVGRSEEGVTVRGESHRGDAVHRAGQAAHQLAIAGPPEPDRRVLAARGEQRAVASEGERKDGGAIPARLRCNTPSATVHSLTVASTLPVASIRESGAKATAVTRCVCPSSTRSTHATSRQAGGPGLGALSLPQLASRSSSVALPCPGRLLDADDGAIGHEVDVVRVRPLRQAGHGQ